MSTDITTAEVLAFRPSACEERACERALTDTSEADGISLVGVGRNNGADVGSGNEDNADKEPEKIE